MSGTAAAAAGESPSESDSLQVFTFSSFKRKWLTHRTIRPIFATHARQWATVENARPKCGFPSLNVWSKSAYFGWLYDDISWNLQDYLQKHKWKIVWPLTNHMSYIILQGLEVIAWRTLTPSPAKSHRLSRRIWTNLKTVPWGKWGTRPPSPRRGYATGLSPEYKQHRASRETELVYHREQTKHGHVGFNC